MFAAAWLPAHAAGAANAPTFRDCSLSGGLDPDFVQLNGATVGPGGTLTVTSGQSSVAVEGSESSASGDQQNQVAFSVTVTGSGASPRTVSGMGTGHVSLSVPLSGVGPGGQYTLDWSATFDNGFHHCPSAMTPENPSSNPFVLHVVAGPPPRGPVITHLRESHRKWRESTGRAAGRHIPVGTTFSFDLSQRAQVRLVFRQMLTGRLRGGKCVPAGKHSSGSRCSRSVVRGAISRQGVAGPNSVRFAGIISRARRLPPGRYVLVLSAINAAGERSAARSIAFTIIG